MRAKAVSLINEFINAIDKIPDIKKRLSREIKIKGKTQSSIEAALKDPFMYFLLITIFLVCYLTYQFNEMSDEFIKKYPNRKDIAITEWLVNSVFWIAVFGLSKNAFEYFRDHYNHLPFFAPNPRSSLNYADIVNALLLENDWQSRLDELPTCAITHQLMTEPCRIEKREDNSWRTHGPVRYEKDILHNWVLKSKSIPHTNENFDSQKFRIVPDEDLEKTTDDYMRLILVEMHKKNVNKNPRGIKIRTA